MRYVVAFALQCVVAPIAAWGLGAVTIGSGPAFRIWLLVDLVIRMAVIAKGTVRVGAYKTRKASAAEGLDPIAAAMRGLAGDFQPASMPRLAIVDSVPGYDNAAAMVWHGEQVVFLSRSVADAQTPEMLGGMLAHELGHLQRDNLVRQGIAGRLLWWSIAGLMAFGWLIGDSFEGLACWIVLRVATSLAYLAIRRSCEIAADRYALRAGAGEGLLDSLDTIDALRARSGRRRRPLPPQWLSTHPSPETRRRLVLAAAHPQPQDAGGPASAR